jgi:hypothetical protein
MSTHVTGYVPADEKWQQMKAVFDACTAAGVPVPDEVSRFFGYTAPDPAGVEVDLPVRPWGNITSSGYELDVDAIPEHVKIIRFFNSW